MNPQDIHIFNTKSQLKEVFSPLTKGEVTIYHCGPTVYHYQHIGNMRRFIFADLIHRLFIQNNYSVKQVINITDVGHLVSDADDGEDKIEKGARREGKSAKEVADFYTTDFMEDLTLLNISKEDTIFPKATDNIPEQIALIKTLEEKGFTYLTSDGVYFDTSKDTHYGDFARLDIEGLKEGARVEANQEKKNITDFALWKFSGKDKRLQEWESPWGIGFPGWHLECSAMAMKFLGKTIDIHTGGVDHINVHHTNEIAQSESATGEIFARYWMHNEHLNFGNEKMAKSGESFIRLKDLVERGYHPLAFRYFTLLAHYQTKINFTFDALDAVSTAWKKVNDFISKTENGGEVVISYIEQAHQYLNDDLDTSRIIALIWEIIKEKNLGDQDKKATILVIDKMIGIIDPTFKGEVLLDPTSLPGDIQAFIEARNTARQEKNWAKSDEIRDTLKQKGYHIKDTVFGIEITKA